MKHPCPTRFDSQPLRPDDVRAITGASDQVMAALGRYVDVLVIWQRRINLVGASTLADPWRRHVLDSYQLVPLIPDACRPILDFGSGAGFPGMVLAIAGVPDVRLIESDARKCAFLHQVNGETGAGATIIRGRIESLPPVVAGAITARALAPIGRLLDYAEPFIGDATRCLFLKGATVEQELTDAGKTWKMRVMRVPSVSDPAGTVLQLQGIRRLDDG